MLDVDRAEHIDAALHEIEHVLVPLGEPASLDVGVREFIDQHHLRSSRQHRIHIHLGKQRSLVIQLTARDLLQPRCQLRCAGAPVCLNYAYHDIFASPAPANPLAQHAVRLANTGRVPQKYLESASVLLGFARSQPLLRRSSLWFSARRMPPCTRVDSSR